ncbi:MULTISPECIES: TauD/TfdA dioxygenase family protein [unclassified Sphingobium]|uniref:TauD/TfdA dioxygenase family protein n=1 Tax=unclassified Sphingobium TaxID=2611147 RepID=UPI00222486A7|nr:MULTISPECIES: TauD/TfdA family dioxygenase [unclassified Sphingobium]MCW2383133.1 alpha-ketoglutarate-dependent 2,4-dichlorophenoxyacetate dioxygenase [Sphingobium sp. B2D3B]MCW2399891.1 alpha-ketoglutarate-dependent 2,4-dichlorophenoxyacetate dioxygenase [Sphingobium sp. B2D3C]
MDVRRLHLIFGAELSGPDLSQVPDQALIDLVERLMDEHVVLCIRGQGHITDEEHLRFARAFGPLELPGMYRPDEPRRMAYGLYDASNLDVNGEIVDRESLRAKFAKGNEIFHADSSFNDMPSKWSMLRGVIVPPERGDTEFVDLRHVYDELPQAMKNRIETLVAEHSFAASRIKGGASPEEAARIREIMPGAMQPMVRISPSGRKSLFVGSHAFRVEGLSDAEGMALIDELIAFASQEKFIYAHKWRQGDLLIWDNRYALHRGTAFDYARYKRDLRRANVNEYGEERSAITAPLRAISN